jgi:toxin ParE1/3/4
MSAPRLRLAITRRAANDLRTIRRYTRKQWGDIQASNYEEAIHHAFENLCAHPEIGKTRDDLLSDLRSHLVVSHIIIYRVDGDTLNVLRIVHQRMDLFRTQLT